MTAKANEKDGPPRNGEELPCIVPDCPNRRKWRGLCGSCYGLARRAIDEGKVNDWGELAQMGLCLLEEKPFTKALNSKLSDRKKAALAARLPGPPSS